MTLLGGWAPGLLTWPGQAGERCGTDRTLAVDT
jgi:hypothetical protein